MTVPLLAGIFWAFYLASVAGDDTTPDKVFGVLAVSSLFWLLLAGIALWTALEEKHTQPNNPLALVGIIIASMQVFFGVLLTPIYFAVWHEVPSASGW